MRPEEIPPAAEIEMIPPARFARARAGTPPDTWTDDGAHALCLLASLLDREALDVEDLGRRLIDWYDHGYMAVDNRVFDVGIQTGTALRSLRLGTPARQSGPRDDRSNGNGSLMRVLPLALWHCGSDAELVQDAHAQSLVTHGHARSQVCCALYCLWARRTLQECADTWADAVATLPGIYAEVSPFVEELEWHIRPDDLMPGGGSGYVVDTLRSARWARDPPRA